MEENKDSSLEVPKANGSNNNSGYLSNSFNKDEDSKQEDKLKSPDLTKVESPLTETSTKSPELSKNLSATTQDSTNSSPSKSGENSSNLSSMLNDAQLQELGLF